MTDKKLRKLERLSLTGDPQAKAQLLIERLRLEQLTIDDINLAAYCGDEAARIIAPDPGWDTLIVTFKEEPIDVTWLTSDNWPLVKWSCGLTRWGPRTLVKAMVIVGELIIHKWEKEDLDKRVKEAAHYIGPDHGMVWKDQKPSQLLKACSEWLKDKTQVNPIAVVQETYSFHYRTFWRHLAETLSSRSEREQAYNMKCYLHRICDSLITEEELEPILKQQLANWALNDSIAFRIFPSIIQAPCRVSL